MNPSEISPTFCPYPFVQASSTNRGNARICCRSVLHRERQPWEAKNYSKTEFETVFNNSYMREVRSRMLKGESVEACRRCYIEEESGALSRRQQELRRIEQGAPRDRDMILSRVREARENDCVIRQSPMNYDLHFGNTCNSKCRTCWPASSQPFFKELEKVVATGMPLPRHTQEEFVALKENQKFWDQKEALFVYLKSHLKTIRRLQIAGGESLMLDQFFEVIDLLVENKLERDVDIELVTNMTIFDLDLLHKLQNFRRVDFLCSIDGTGAVNDYIRFPSRWHKITKNFRNLVQTLKDAPSVNVYVQATISNLNFYYLPDLVDWVMNENLPREVGLILNHVHSPEFFHISVMPADLKRKSIERVEIWLESVRYKTPPAHVNNFESIVDKTLMFLRLARESQSDHDTLLDEVRTFSAALDLQRGQRSAEVLPEVADLFEATRA